MSLIECRECKTQLSNKAKICTKCGLPNPQPKNRFRWWHALILFIAFGWVIGTIFTPPKKVLTPEEELESKKSLTRSTLALSTIKMIKKSAKDPDSVKFTSMRVDETGDVVCAEFRAKNSFGAVVPSIFTASIKKNINSTDTKDWNKYCTGKMYDMSPLYRF